MPLDFANLRHSELAPSPRSSGRTTGRHFVQLYEHDSILVDAVGTFITLGLARGDAGIVIAEPAHRNAIEQSLAASGIDTPAARSQGSYVPLDAEEELARFMVDGMPDPAKFTDVMGAVIDAAGQGGRRIRIFGEMVGVLWRQGNIPAAINVEEYWNELARSHQFQLFCAYPAYAIDPADLVHIEEICRQHMQVIPPAQARI